MKICKIRAELDALCEYDTDGREVMLLRVCVGESPMMIDVTSAISQEDREHLQCDLKRELNNKTVCADGFIGEHNRDDDIYQAYKDCTI
jgi:hypothetical protein